MRVSINHLDRLGKPNQPVHLVQFARTAVWVVWFVCVGSWLFGVGIELRLSCWIPDFVRKVLEFFEIFFQPSGPVGKTKPAGSIWFSLLERQFGWFGLFVLVLGYSESELNSVWIPDFVRKVLEFFEIFFQPSGPVGKTKPAGSFGSVR